MTVKTGNGTNAGTSPVPDNYRWIAYISPDRRVLWSETEGSGPFPPGETPESLFIERTFENETWQNAIDAAFATRLPQYGALTLGPDGGVYSLKAFPDFGPGGQLMGVIQVIESQDVALRHSPVGNRNREIHTVLDLTLCGIVLYDPAANRIQNVNRRVAQQTGYSLRELEGMNGTLLFGDDGVSLLRSTHQRMVKAGESMVWGQMVDIRDRRGRTERYFASLRIIDAAPEDNAAPVMLVSLDEVETDTVTGAVRDGPNPRFVLEALQDGLWEYDAVRRVFYYSETYGEIFGPDGLPDGPGKDMDEWLDEIYPGESQQVLHSWRQLLKLGERYRVAYRIRDRAGAWRWIMATIHAILNDGTGRPARVLGFHMDITDVMQTDTRLIDTEERFRTVFENAGMGIAVCDTEGPVSRVNPAFAIMLGRDRGDFEGKWLSDFACLECQQDMKDALERLLRGGRRESVPECLFMRPDGRQVWVNLTVTLSRRISDGARYVIVMAEDVTASRANREKLQYEATHDVMTGAWSRWVLLERLGQHVHLAVRHRQPMAFCICDLDHFKRVNDEHGHQAGDQVLIRFVEILKDAVRETDVVGRYGGEEFAVVFPNTDVGGAAHSLGRALEHLREERFADSSGRGFGVTATFGITGVSETSDLRSVVTAADSALYLGKREGRDQVVVAVETGDFPWF